MPGQIELRAGLPPAVLAADDLRIQAGVQLGPGAHAAELGFHLYPVAGGDATHPGGLGVELYLGVGRPAAQTGHLAVLRLGEPQGLSGRQDQRKALRQIGSGSGAGARLLELRKRRIAPDP